jgi:hypothetical protein
MARNQIRTYQATLDRIANEPPARVERILNGGADETVGGEEATRPAAFGPESA